MKTILNHLKNYFKNNFSQNLYLSLGLWLVILFAFNYAIDFEDSYVDKITSFPLRLGGHFLFNSLPFLVACFLVGRFGKYNFLNKTEFWSRFLIGFLLFAIYRSAHFRINLCEILDVKVCSFLLGIVKRALRFLVLLVPLLIFYKRDKDQMVGFYGLAFIPKHLKIYLPIIAIMAVVIFIASFLPSIQNFYPMYAKSGGDTFAKYNDLPRWLSLASFEISYLSNFISIEFFFRGFLIFSFIRYLGPQVVLPAVCCYAVLHFGKPFAEAFSSIFGGYILSILALQTKNIWGGIFVHVGVAGMMELFTWFI